MPNFNQLNWQFEYNDRGTHSGNYLDKLNQLVSGFNTTISAYNAQLTAAADAESMKTITEQFKNEALAFRNQAEAIALGNIQGTHLDLASCKIAGIDVATIEGNVANATNAINSTNAVNANNSVNSDKLGNQLPGYYGKQSDITALNNLVFSSDTALDEIQEIVNYIKLNRTDLDALSITSIAGLVAALASKSPVHDHPYSLNTHHHNTSYLGINAKANSAGNADTLAGLGVNPIARNDQVNKVVRTDASGYAQFGWLNTTSGASTTGTLFACFNSANDMYLRYMTAANMRARLDVDSKIIYGSNANGSYTKLPDGTLICYANKTTWMQNTYPMSFVSPPFVAATPVGTASMGLVVYESNNINFSAAAYKRDNSQIIFSVSFSYIAIGRWK